MLSLCLGLCLGIITTIRHASLIFLLFILMVVTVFLFFQKISVKRKLKLLSLVILPAIIISASYLVFRCVLLGDIKFLLNFGANSNLWIDSSEELWYYQSNGLPNPSLNDYLQEHTLFYIIQREFSGILHIFTGSLFPQFSIFFIALGFIVLIRKNFTALIIILIPIIYIVVTYGWLWDCCVSTLRYLLPIYYIFYILTAIAISYIASQCSDLSIKIASILSIFFWFRLFIYFPINFLELFISAINKISLMAVIVSYIAFLGISILLFYSSRRIALNTSVI